MGKLTSRSADIPGGQASRLSRTTGFQPVGIYLLVLLAAFLPAATVSAQTSALTETTTPTPPVPTSPSDNLTPDATKPTASPAPATSPLKIIPSRFVEETNLDAYIASLSSMFSMRERASDPFGQLQDPDAKPVIKATVAKTTRRAAPVQATPFSEIIRLIKVTTIMPKEQRFLVGTRSFKQGDNIPLSFRGKNINVQVSAINSRQIEFRNLDNNETAALQLNLLPTGMTAGSATLSAPGMVRDRPDSPIELEPGNPTNKNPPPSNTPPP